MNCNVNSRYAGRLTWDSLRATALARYAEVSKLPKETELVRGGAMTSAKVGGL